MTRTRQHRYPSQSTSISSSEFRLRQSGMALGVDCWWTVLFLGITTWKWEEKRREERRRQFAYWNRWADSQWNKNFIREIINSSLKIELSFKLETLAQWRTTVDGSLCCCTAATPAMSKCNSTHISRHHHHQQQQREAEIPWGGGTHVDYVSTADDSVSCQVSQRQGKASARGLKHEITRKRGRWRL